MMLVIGGCVAMVILTPRSKEAEEKDRREAARVQALQVCHDAARGRLKAPASAKFPSVYTPPEGVESGVIEKSTTLDNLTLRPGSRFVRSYVDSQNSFGALIRTRFACAVDENGRLLAFSFAK
jgi:hypothetical protein